MRTGPDKITRLRAWKPHRLKPYGADYHVWRRLDRVRSLGANWGAAFDDFIRAAIMLRDIGELDYVLDRWPHIRSKRLRSWGADVIVAARWIQQNPDTLPTCHRVWPQLFPDKNL